MPGQKTILASITGGILAIVLALALAPILAPPTWGQRLAPYKTYTRQPPSKGVYYLQDLEKKIFRLTNEARRKQGLSTLAERENLVAQARAYSEDMLRRKFFSHVNPDGLSLQERMPRYAVPVSRAGENLWSGTGQDLADKNLLARSIVDSWLLSPGHRENLLHPDYTHMGVGVAVLDPEIRVTQLFVREIAR